MRNGSEDKSVAFVFLLSVFSNVVVQHPTLVNRLPSSTSSTLSHAGLCCFFVVVFFSSRDLRTKKLQTILPK